VVLIDDGCRGSQRIANRYPRTFCKLTMELSSVRMDASVKLGLVYAAEVSSLEMALSNQTPVRSEESSCTTSRQALVPQNR
jgi:hypothetical protein